MMAVALAGCSPRVAPPDGRPDVIVVLTDDQRVDTLHAMPLTDARLGEPGVRFTRAYVTTPMCCPIRASMLSGGWGASTLGVTANEGPNGGATRFLDADTVATRFQQAGYATALVGKYLNEYDHLAPYVPPGWDVFVALSDMVTWTDWEVTRQTGRPERGTQYLTDFERDEALGFLDAHVRQPVFLYVAVPAPHNPATPAVGDEELFADEVAHGEAWDEADVSDKSRWVRNEAPLDDVERASLDDIARAQLRSLQAVDRLVEAVAARQEERGRLEETVFVFASDNGFLLGEHRLRGKAAPYEEAVRVPLIVRAPGLSPRTEDGLVAANLDLGETLSALAGLPGLGEGRDLLGDPAREQLPIEHYSRDAASWAGVVTPEWKWVEQTTGEVEIYDLLADPAELESLHDDPPAEATALAEAARAARGLVIRTETLPPMVAGTPWSVALEAWGGTEPYTWSLHGGTTLPACLTLTSTGLLSGLCAAAEEVRVEIAVTDSSSGAATGEPQRFVRPFTPLFTGEARAHGRRLDITVHGPWRVEIDADGSFDDFPHVVARGSGPASVELPERVAWRVRVEGTTVGRGRVGR